MSNNLFFIPLIDDAFKAVNTKAALRVALLQIVELGRKPEYQQGYIQFQRFMAEVIKSTENRSFISADGSELITTPQQRIEIMIERNSETIGCIPIEDLPATRTIRSLTPGLFTVRLNTGRIIWEGKLKHKDLTWTAAFPERALDMAADSGETLNQTTLEIRLLDGEIILRIFPEIESGRMDIEIRSWKNE